MLGLPARATVTEIMSAVQALQRDNKLVRQSAATWAEAYHKENNKVRKLSEASSTPPAEGALSYADLCKAYTTATTRADQLQELLQIANETSNRSEAERVRAMDPTNWRATFTGDAASTGTLFTCLTPGNLVTIEGTGQVLFHFHPCCKDTACKCERTDENGHCPCHTYAHE